MKLSIHKYSQRDQRWASILLGYNTNPIYTIGDWGCLITSFAMYLTSIGRDKDPETVNEELKAGNGYAPGGGLLNWSAIPRIYGLNLEYQSPYYDGPVTTYGINKMKECLDQRKPLICHVDFNPSTVSDDMHWLLVNGYEGDEFFACDPWTGQQISLDVYGGVKRAVIEFRVYDKTIEEDNAYDCESELASCRLSRDNHWNDLMAIKDQLSVTGEYSLFNIQTRIDGLLAQEEAVGDKDKQLTQAQNEVQELKEQVEKAKKTNQDLQSKVTDQQVDIMKQQSIIGDLDVRIKQLEKDTQPADKSAIEYLLLFFKKLIGR